MGRLPVKLQGRRQTLVRRAAVKRRPRRRPRQRPKRRLRARRKHGRPRLQRQRRPAGSPRPRRRPPPPTCQQRNEAVPDQNENGSLRCGCADWLLQSVWSTSVHCLEATLSTPRSDRRKPCRQQTAVFTRCFHSHAYSIHAYITGRSSGAVRPAWSGTQIWDTSQRVATAAGVPNWSPGPRTQSITTGMIVISAVRIDTLQTFPMSPGTQSQDTSSYKTTRAAC